MFFRNGMLVMTADDYITREEDRCIARQTDKAYKDAEMHLYEKIIGNFIAVRVINDGDTRVRSRLNCFCCLMIPSMRSICFCLLAIVI